MDALKKLLVVDDEPEIVELVSLLLDGEGRRLLAAHDGQQALEMARREKPDLLLTDVMMPRLDGRELCRQVKADPATDHVRVALMSAMRTLEPGECRADALIPKPFDLDEVVATVERLLGEAG